MQTEQVASSQSFFSDALSRFFFEWACLQTFQLLDGNKYRVALEDFKSDLRCNFLTLAIYKKRGRRARQKEKQRDIRPV